jgi:hypothetical protein
MINFAQHRVRRRRITRSCPPHPPAWSIADRKDLLKAETDPVERALLHKLLAEEGAKQAFVAGKSPGLRREFICGPANGDKGTQCCTTTYGELRSLPTGA